MSSKNTEFYIVQFLTNTYIFSGCPAVLEIILQNEAKEKYSIFEGTYLISDSLVNGNKYWNQEGKGGAIWYDINNYWIVNDDRWLGQSIALLWNSDSTASCPNFGNWHYWDTNDWITPNNDDIIFLASGNPTFISRQIKERLTMRSMR